MNPDEFQLVEQYVDGTIGKKDVPRLQSLLSESAQARAMLRTLATLDFGLQDIAEGQDTLANSNDQLNVRRDKLARAWASSRHGWTKAILATAAAAIIALGVALYLQRANYEYKLANVPVHSDSSNRDIAEITGLGGVVVWTGDGGKVTTDLNVGTKLTGGTIEGASPTSWVELEFLDGSSFTVSGDSRLTFSDFGQKVLHLKEGNFASNVKPQSVDRPMLVHTRNAFLEILGTEFKVESEVDSTSLNVTEGKVRLRRLSDGQTVDVPANQRVLAVNGSELSAQPIPASVSQWKSDLNQPDHTFGRWLPRSDSAPSRLKVVPYRHTTTNGQTVMVMNGGVAVSGRDDEQILLYEDSKIRVRGFTHPSQLASFGVLVRGTNGSFGGIFVSYKPDNAEFWIDLSPAVNQDVAIGELRQFELVLSCTELLLSPDLAAADFPVNPLGSIAEVFFGLSPTEKVGMEITEIEIFRAGE